MEIPARAQINVYDSLDERVACENFLGKDLAAAEDLFCEINPLSVTENLTWMGPAAFRYYVHAAINYARSEAALGDADFVNGFASTLEFRLKNERGELRPVAEPLVSVCNFILERWDRFDANEEIYGDLKGRYVALEQSLRALR